MNQKRKTTTKTLRKKIYNVIMNHMKKTINQTKQKQNGENKMHENKLHENQNWIDFSINEHLYHDEITKHVASALIHINDTIEDEDFIIMILDANHVAL